MPDLVLHQFLYSHFNDKARWALAWKGVQHQRVSYLPGPHIAAIKRLSGQPQTPVLDVGGDIVAGSGSIIAALERHYPEPPLYPAAAAQREAALALEQRFDRELGPATRTLLFDVLISEPDYLCAMFATGKAAWKRRAYRASFALAKPLMARGNGVNAANISRSRTVVAETLDDIAARVASTGYLVGASFSVADLSAAALLAPLCNPPVEDMQRPQPMPSPVQQLLARYAAHPAIDWTLEMYRRHRT